MVSRRTKVLMIFVVAALAPIGIWLLQSLRNRPNAAQREERYRPVLALYAGNLKPRMDREKVEHYLHSNRIPFRQMCCVAGFRGERANSGREGWSWDDLVKNRRRAIPVGLQSKQRVHRL